MSKTTWKNVDAKEKERLAGLYKAGAPLDDEADKLGIKVVSLEREIRQYVYYRSLFIGNTAAQISIPKSPSRQWLDYEVVDGDDWIIAGDIEIPDHRAEILKLILLTAMARGIKNLCISGDLIATDQQALNEWISTWKTGEELNYEDSVDLVVSILNEFAEWFEQIVIIEGNHDDRISRKTGGEVYLGMFIPRDLARYSRYSYLYIQTSKRGLVKVVHPQNFSSTPVKLGQDFYDVERGPNFDWQRPFETAQKCHFVISHTHIDQAGYSKDSVYEIHAIGTCRDDTRTAYKNRKQNKHHQWSPSFLVMEGGHFTHMHLWGTNWQKELGPLFSEFLKGA